MKRFETYKLGEIVDKFDIFEVPWLSKEYHKKYKRLIVGTMRIKLM